MKDSPARQEQLAREVLLISHNSLVVSLRFLATALSMLEPAPYQGSIAVDGEHIYFDPRWVLRRYMEDRYALTRAYLHMLLHCVFHHAFVSGLVNRSAWDLACDIAVENIINELELACINNAPAKDQRDAMKRLPIGGERLTAERIYSNLISSGQEDRQLERSRQYFVADDHSGWYGHRTQPASGAGEGEGQEGENPAGATGFAALQQSWTGTAESMQAELESFAKERGDRAAAFMQSLRAVTREKYDYAAFLRSFAVLGEAMKTNDEEFDYVFYTYGLKLYENMPLIEPLEYKEVKRIKEFVIDTSGSVKGEQVQLFLQKTYNILKQQESFFTKINLHIIQCDANIQEDARISSQEEFDEYLKTMTLRGFGGTDFRPVFSYVDELIFAGEFTNLKGLIYFTDGQGVFPAEMPDYRAAFVFVSDTGMVPWVPVWAMSLALLPGEI